MPTPTLMGICRYADCLPLIDCRAKARLPQNPQTVVMCLFPYHTGELENRNIARYAAVNDYHNVVGGILEKTAAQLKAAFPSGEFVPFVDSSPIREVTAAALAGLGAVGRNGMLIHKEYGSRVFIGEIVTNLILKAKPAAPQNCENCGACISACPTGALKAGKPLQKERCRSFLTQKKAALSDWEKAEITAGKLAWGCDICQDICPMNKNLPLSHIAEFFENITPRLTHENLCQVMAQKPLGWRGKDVLLRNLSLIGVTPWKF